MTKKKKQIQVFIFSLILSLSIPVHSGYAKTILSTIQRVSEIKSSLFQTRDWALFDLDGTLFKENQNRSELLDPNAPELIRQIQATQAKAIGLTSRRFRNHESTLAHLNAAGIHFSPSSNPDRPSIEMNKVPESGYSDGIIHTGGSHISKGEILLSFLRTLSPKDRPTRIYFADDRKENLESLQKLEKAFEELGIQDIFLYHVQPPNNATSPDDPFPRDVSKLEIMNHISGGTGGVDVFIDPSTKKKYVLKSNANQKMMNEEIIATALYQALGVPVPKFKIYHQKPIPSHPLYILSEFIEGETLARELENSKIRHGYSNSNLSPILKKQIKDQVGKHFVIDALLSNWDIIIQGKNIVVDSKGVPYRVDNGGSLRQRALGESKRFVEGWDPDRVTELGSMRDPKVTQDGAEIYGSLTSSQIKKQILELLPKKELILSALQKIADEIQLDEQDYNDLQRMLMKRLENLELISGVKPVGIASKDEPATLASGAGILPYFKQGNQYFTVLGKRSGTNSSRYQGSWSNFGGKSDPAYLSSSHRDLTLADTASREAFEESNGLIYLNPLQLSTAYSHDLVPDPMADTMSADPLLQQDPVRNKILYRTYLVPIEPLSRDELAQAAQKPQFRAHQEYSDYRVVPLNNLLEAIDKGLGSVAVTAPHGQSEQLKIYPPLLDTLRQKPMRNTLASVLAGKKVLRTHTQSKVTSAQDYDYDPARGLDSRWSNLQRTLRSNNQALSKESYVEDPLTVDSQHAEAVVLHGTLLRELKKKTAQTSPSLQDKSPDQDQSHKPDFKYTQTEAYLKLVFPEYRDIDAGQSDEKIYQQLKDNIVRFLKFRGIEKNPAFEDFGHYVDSLTEAAMLERKNNDKYVFYHGMNEEVAFFSDFISELRNQMRISGKDEVFLRALDKAFRQFPDLQSFISAFKDNYDGNYQDMGLSTNPFLFGNQAHPSSCTFLYFLNSQSSQPPNFEGLYNFLASTLGLSKDYASLRRILTAHAKNPGRLSRLEQILIDPSVVSQIAYSAGSGGTVTDFPHPPDLPASTDFSKTMPAFRKDPEKFAKLKDIETIQGRIFLNPDLLYDGKSVKIHPFYRGNLSGRELYSYKHDIENFVHDELKSSLLSRYNVNEQFNTPSKLHSVYEKSVLGRRNKAFHYKKNEAFFSEMISQGNLPAVLEYLKQNPELDLTIPIRDVSYRNSEKIPDCTPIEFALKKEKPEIAKALVEAKGRQVFLTHPRYKNFLLTLALNSNDSTFVQTYLPLVTDGKINAEALKGITQPMLHYPVLMSIIYKLHENIKRASKSISDSQNISDSQSMSDQYLKLFMDLLRFSKQAHGAGLSYSRQSVLTLLAPTDFYRTPFKDMLLKIIEEFKDEITTTGRLILHDLFEGQVDEPLSPLMALVDEINSDDVFSRFEYFYKLGTQFNASGLVKPSSGGSETTILNYTKSLKIKSNENHKKIFERIIAELKSKYSSDQFKRFLTLQRQNLPFNPIEGAMRDISETLDELIRLSFEHGGAGLINYTTNQNILHQMGAHFYRTTPKSAVEPYAASIFKQLEAHRYPGGESWLVHLLSFPKNNTPLIYSLEHRTEAVIEIFIDLAITHNGAGLSLETRKIDELKKMIDLNYQLNPQQKEELKQKLEDAFTKILTERACKQTRAMNAEIAFPKRVEPACK